MLFDNKILGIYKKELVKRNDDYGTAFYYAHTDFDGLNALPYSFTGSFNQTLNGNFYYYGEIKKDRLVIFEHGMGGGHRSYMKEIELLARHGFTVLGYDHTGCMTSGGEHIVGFAQSVCDLDYCINSLKNTEFGDAAISVVGHSWGGYSTLNIGALHPEVTHLVAISAFISVEAMVTRFFPGVLKKYIPAVLEYERQNNPKYVDLNAADSLSKTKAKLLVIHSADDDTVKSKYHFEVLKNRLSTRENTEFMLLQGKNHNPNFTVDAVAYKDKFFKDLTAKIKNNEFTTEESKAKFKASYDFDRMTQQDMTVWEKIFAFLDN